MTDKIPETLAVMDARIARINEALANEAIAIVGSSYKQNVVSLLQAELANTLAARAAVAELIKAAKCVAASYRFEGPDAFESLVKVDQDAILQMCAALAAVEKLP